MRILQIANYQEGIGGISVQVKLLQENLLCDGHACDILSTKGSFGKRMKAIARLFKTGRHYDVFHVHACSGRGFFPAVVGITAGRILRKRTILTYHGGGAEAFFEKHHRMIRRYLSKTTANIALSGFTGEIFDHYGLKYTIIPNIVELDAAHFRKREVLQPHYISIRTLADTYNHECTLRAFARVKQEIPEATLILVGDGPKRAELEEFVRGNKIQDVTFAGQVQNEDIYAWLDQADIMISSSRADNMPVSILEGFNAGLLVIASRVGGIPYMIEDGVNGYLFDPAQSDQLYEKMLIALKEREKTLRMISQAQSTLGIYLWSNIAKKLIPLYQS